MDVKFNINDYVKVKLTPRGLTILRKEWEQYHIERPSVVDVFKEYSPPNVNADGWTRFQMWDLMKTFGPYIHMGITPPFETNIEFSVGE